jgi:uracil-DNA glycosylase
MASTKLDRLLSDVRDCQICSEALPLGPRPVVRAKRSARVLIIGQAPGTKVHESGVPWEDRSGDRLREWLSIDKETFYDDGKFAIVPMGFCYPGREKSGGDKPPRPECAPEWHPKILPALPGIQLTLLVGSYAQAYYLGKSRGRTMTETVENWRTYLPQYLPTPHPSWRTTGWAKKNLWFETDLLPELRNRVTRALADQ